MTKKFIACEDCLEWTDEQRCARDCFTCKGRGIIRDPDQLLCNNCGGKMCPAKPDMNWQLPNGLYNASVAGDYSSTHLHDCTVYEFSLCEFCLRIMFNCFQIPPTVYDEDKSISYMTYENDKELYDYQQWARGPSYKEAYLNKKCNAKKECSEIAAYTILNNTESYSIDCCCEQHKGRYDRSFSYKLVPFIPDTLKSFV